MSKLPDETWLWSFEEKVINNLIPNYDSFTRCTDMYDNISNFQAPSGKGGVGIVWPKEWSHLVKRLKEGNERIVLIELQCQKERLCIVNVYMPTLNLPQSKSAYQEHLDLLYSILNKYKNSHRIVLCGDFNATLLSERNNPHDKLLKQFVSENQLTNVITVPNHTFFLPY